MAKDNNLTDFLTDLANAIRAKKGTTVAINPQNFSAEIASITSGASDSPNMDGKYLVQVIDYDGKVLKQSRLDTDATFTLPENPSHTALVFDGWSSPVTITNNEITVGNSDITIGAMYHTASDKTEIDITLTKKTGLTCTLSSLSGTYSIDWGDGTTDRSLSHTYATYGDYTINISGATGLGYLFLGHTTITGSLGMFVAVRIASSVTTIGANAFSNCVGLTSVSMPISIRNFSSQLFNGCYSLTGMVIPNGISQIYNTFFYRCYSLTAVAIPSSVTSIGSGAFRECVKLRSITLPSGITSILDSAFQGCSGLESITLPSAITTIVMNMFNKVYALESIVIPSGVTNIGGNAFMECYACKEYDFSNHTAVPTLSHTTNFNGIKEICKIKVPASLEAEWKAATNWSTYADYIEGVSIPFEFEEVTITHNDKNDLLGGWGVGSTTPMDIAAGDSVRIIYSFDDGADVTVTVQADQDGSENPVVVYIANLLESGNDTLTFVLYPTITMDEEGGLIAGHLFYINGGGIYDPSTYTLPTVVVKSVTKL